MHLFWGKKNKNQTKYNLNPFPLVQSINIEFQKKFSFLLSFGRMCISAPETSSGSFHGFPFLKHSHYFQGKLFPGLIIQPFSLTGNCISSQCKRIVWKDIFQTKMFYFCHLQQFFSCFTKEKK